MYNQSGTVHEYYVNFMNIFMNINSTNLETQEVDFLLKINPSTVVTQHCLCHPSVISLGTVDGV